MKRRFYIALFMLCAATQLAAQSFSSLRKEGGILYDERLNTLLEQNDGEGMKQYLQSTPGAVKKASGWISETGKYTGKVQLKYIPLIHDALSRCLKGNCSVTMCSYIVQGGADLSQPFDGKTPVYLLLDYLARHKIAECTQAEELFRLLLARTDFDINARYQSLLPPLSYLIRENSAFLGGRFSKEYLSPDLIRRMIDKGASVNTYDAEGNTLIAYVLATDNQELQTYLIDKGINIRKENKEGRDAMYLAIESKNLPSVRNLMQSGYQLNLHTLKNESAGFKSDRELYDFIADLCAADVTSAPALKLFNEKFPADTRTPGLDDRIFAQLLTQNTPAGYNEYMSLFPRGKNFGKAKHNLYSLEYEAIKPYYAGALRYIETSSPGNEDRFKLYPQTYKAGEGISVIRQFVRKYKEYDPDSRLPYANDALDLNLLAAAMQQYVDYGYLRDGSFQLWGRVIKEYYVLEKDKMEAHSTCITDGYKAAERLIVKNLEGKEPLFTRLSDELIIKADYLTRIYNQGVDKYNAYLGRQQVRREEAQQMLCDQCEIDLTKSRMPKDTKDFLGFDDQHPGVIRMKNGEKFEFHYRNKQWAIPGFFSSRKFDGFDELIREFIKECEAKYCK